jgi:hypothetical protein
MNRLNSASTLREPTRAQDDAAFTPTLQTVQNRFAANLAPSAVHKVCCEHDILSRIDSLLERPVAEAKREIANRLQPLIKDLYAQSRAKELAQSMALATENPLETPGALETIFKSGMIAAFSNYFWKLMEVEAIVKGTPKSEQNLVKNLVNASLEKVVDEETVRVLASRSGTLLRSGAKKLANDDEVLVFPA